MADFYQTGLLATFHRLGALESGAPRKRPGRVQPAPAARPRPADDAQGARFAGPATASWPTSRRSAYLNEIVVTLGPDRRSGPFRPGPEALLRPAADAQDRLGLRAALPRALSAPRGERPFGRRGRQGPVGLDGLRLHPGPRGEQGHRPSRLRHRQPLPGAASARLFYPVASPHIDYAFCKGYYARVTDRMHGRVTRLFVTPLVRSLIKLFGYLPFLVYLDSFRYALAGEFSMITDLARINRIPSDWGLEVETLAEVYRNYSLRRICQAEICETYEHKHQPLSAEDPRTGLMKMAVDIAKSVFRNLAVESIVLSESALRTLVINYQRTAKDAVKRYSDDADFNGLAFDYHLETVIVEAFTRAIQIAGQGIHGRPALFPAHPELEPGHLGHPRFPGQAAVGRRRGQREDPLAGLPAPRPGRRGVSSEVLEVVRPGFLVLLEPLLQEVLARSLPPRPKAKARPRTAPPNAIVNAATIVCRPMPSCSKAMTKANSRTAPLTPRLIWPGEP